MFPVKMLFILATLLLKFVGNKRSDMIIGSTEHVFFFEGEEQLPDPDKYRTQKFYFYFRSSALIFSQAPSSAPFCPPLGEFLELYMSLQRHSSYEIELMALDDPSFAVMEKNTKNFAGFQVGAMPWLIEYLKNEFFDADRGNKANYSFSEGALRMRKLYDDLLRYGASESTLDIYKNTIAELHQNRLFVDADRCGNMDEAGSIKIGWLIDSAFEFIPDQGLVALNTNLSHMSKIISSKALFIQSPSRLSHAAIVAQELGKPCFLGIQDIFLFLWHGDEVAFFPGSSKIQIMKRFYER